MVSHLINLKRNNRRLTLILRTYSQEDKKRMIKP